MVPWVFPGGTTTLFISQKKWEIHHAEVVSAEMGEGENKGDLSRFL